MPSLVCVVVGFAATAVPDPSAGLVVVGLTCMGWSVMVVHRRGGPYITPSGVLYLAGGVFVGIASLYLASAGFVTDEEVIVLAAAVAFATTVLTEVVACCWRIRWRLTWVPPSRSELRALRFRTPQQYLLKGIALIVVSRLPFSVALSFELARAVGLVGVLMTVAVSVSLAHRIRWGGDLALVVIGVVSAAVWAQQVFQGGGRLILVGVAMAVWMTWNVLHPAGWQKVVLVAAIPVFLIVAGVNRLDKNSREWGIEVEATGGKVFASGAGLESVFDPLDRFGQFISVDEYPSGGTIGPRYGATFVNTLMLPIPRSSWSGKPKGFGAEITEVMEPDLVRTGQSYAALVQGEWYANFGWLGLALMPLVLGWIIARLDLIHARLVASRMQADTDWWRLLALACVVASLGDLFWVGSFGFYERGGLAALVALSVRFASRRSVRTSGDVSMVEAAPPPGLRPPDTGTDVSVDVPVEVAAGG